MNLFRGRPYTRLLRQLDAARHTLITETARAEDAASKAALAQQQIARLEAWIKEQDDAHQKRLNAMKYPPMPPRHGSNGDPTYEMPPAPPSPPLPPHMHGYQPHPA